MPYASTHELPATVREALPAQGLDLYLSAYNSAWDDFVDAEDLRRPLLREEVSHRIAWVAVKRLYSKDASGRWRLRS